MKKGIKSEFELGDVVRVLCPCGNDTFVKIVRLGIGLGFTSWLADETDEILPINLLPFRTDSVCEFEGDEFSKNILREILRSEGLGEHRIRWRRVVKLYKGNDTYVN